MRSIEMWSEILKAQTKSRTTCLEHLVAHTNNVPFFGKCLYRNRRTLSKKRDIGSITQNVLNAYVVFTLSCVEFISTTLTNICCPCPISLSVVLFATSYVYCTGACIVYCTALAAGVAFAPVESPNSPPPNFADLILAT